MRSPRVGVNLHKRCTSHNLTVMYNLRRSVPPLGSLVTFEAAARHGSFTRAADELAVTQVAVSRQIKALEAYLGVRLFDRLNRAVRLTPEGEVFRQAVSEGLTRVAAAVTELRRGEGRGQLVVGTTTAFSAYWLMPRLTRFRSAHPEIDLRFAIDDRCVDLGAAGIDLSIRYGSGHWRGVDAVHLRGSDAVPLCSPSYWSDRPPITDPRALLAETLLDYDNIVDSRWSSWFAHHGISLRSDPAGVATDAFTSMVQAAQNSQGIALLGSPVVDDLIASGALIAPTIFGRWILPGGYYAVTPKMVEESPGCASFRNWLQDEMAAVSGRRPC